MGDGTKNVELMGIREYARHKNMHLNSVQHAMATGRIPYVLDAEGKKKIDPAVADAALAANTDPSKQGRKIVLPAGEVKKEGYQESRAKREKWAARHAELEYRRKSRQLVKASEVREAAFEVHRTLRNDLINIPDRLSSELAAETDAHKIHQALLIEINRVLENLSKNLTES